MWSGQLGSCRTTGPVEGSAYPPGTYVWNLRGPDADGSLVRQEPDAATSFRFTIGNISITQDASWRLSPSRWGLNDCRFLRDVSTRPVVALLRLSRRGATPPGPPRTAVPRTPSRKSQRLATRLEADAVTAWAPLWSPAADCYPQESSWCHLSNAARLGTLAVSTESTPYLRGWLQEP